MHIFAKWMVPGDKQGNALRNVGTCECESYVCLGWDDLTCASLHRSDTGVEAYALMRTVQACACALAVTLSRWRMTNFTCNDEDVNTRG